MLTIFVASSGPAPTGPGLSCSEGSRAGHRTPVGVSPEWSRGAESSPSPCCRGCSLGYGWPSGLRVHIAGSYPIFHPPVSPSPSVQGCSQSINSPVCIDIGNCHDPGAGPCTQLGVICKLAEGALNPTVYVINKDNEPYESQYRPLRDTTCC